jgi:DNA transposition AAA+ family ATPase
MEETRQLQELVLRMEISNAEIARISGKSTGTVSQVLSGKYKGRPEVAKEILDALALYEEGLEKVPREPWFTDGQQLIMSVLFLTHQTSGFSVVVGPSGIGKTYTARHFLEKHGDVRYLRCADGMCMGDVIDSLLELTGAPSYGSNSHRLKRAIRTLKEQGVRMILVDEADLLVTDGSKPKILKKISVFREVKESGIGVSLIGLESFDTALRTVGETYVTSRIDLFRRTTSPSMDELGHYMAELGCDPETESARRAISLAPKNGSLRFVEKAVQITKHLGGNMLEALRVLFAASGHVKGV